MALKRRSLLKMGVAVGAALAAPRLALAADTVKIGAVAPKTGPLAGGSTVTHWPNIQLWASQMNAQGGVDVAGTRKMVEVIEYDDQTNPGETIKAVQRLATQDSVDHIVAPYGTGFNIAAAPLFDRYKYPHLAVSAITDQTESLAEQFNGMYFLLGNTTSFVQAVADVFKQMQADGTLTGNKISMVNVADAFGIELATAARRIFVEEGFELVYDTSYPLGSQDLSPVMKAAKGAEPNAFVAWSYPPDTFGLTEQAIIEDLNVEAYYTAVATCFPAFGGRFGGQINNCLGAGGIDPSTEAFQTYAAAHTEVTGAAPDYWASATTYASLQILEQTMAAVGLDREAAVEHIAATTFDTVMGDMSFNANHFNERYWTVGQWQDGVFRGVAETGRDGAVPIRVKQGWA
ncbi:MAG: amino acid ABC transporter substrate-binding protein [Pseudomonadota bacterium]